MAARKNSTDATLAAWKFADLFNRRFGDRDRGLKQLEPPLRNKARSVLEATDNLRANNGWIRNPDALFKLADSARGELEKAKLGLPPLATDAQPPSKPAEKSDDSWMILVIVVVVGVFAWNVCSAPPRASRSGRSKVHYVNPAER